MYVCMCVYVYIRTCMYMSVVDMHVCVFVLEGTLFPHPFASNVAAQRNVHYKVLIESPATI